MELRNGNPAPADVNKVALVVGVEKDFAALKLQLVEAMKGANVIAPNSKPGNPFGGVVTYDVPDGPAAATNQDAGKVKQGMIGDCAFLSTIIGMVRARGGTSPIVTIGKNIDPTNNQFDYRVKFPGADSADRIKRPTQSQIALYANAGDNGLWLSILEKGYAKARKQNYDDFFGGFFSKDTYKVLEGQSLKAAMKIITGRKPAANLSGRDLTAAAVRSQLQAVMGVPDKNGYAPLKVIATAGSLPSDQDPTDVTLLPAGHAYAVIGYNKTTKEVRLENPWHNPRAYAL